MTECAAGCGRCCDPVATCFDPATKTDGPSAAFIRDHWQVTDHDATDDGQQVWRSRCDQFDPATRLCLARDERPPICSGYPWYAGEKTPQAGQPLDPGCSFNADIPGLLLPLYDVTGQRP